MFKRRRGFLLKLFLAIILFWIGTVLYVAIEKMSNDEIDNPLGLRHQTPLNGHDNPANKKTDFRAAFEPLQPNRIKSFQEETNEELERQKRFHKEQEDLKRLLSKTDGAVIPQVSVHAFLDNDTSLESLIAKGLIVPKWNKDVEIPEYSLAPGENGKAVLVNKDSLSESERRKYEIAWQANAFNGYASDMMSLHRTLPDVRDPECKNMKYSDNLPDTSVIIIFHNEDWKPLLRTVHSVLDRSPPHLIKEIILVDDFSSHDHLKTQLEVYMAKLGKIKILRAKKREGLIRARLLGASAATGQVLTYLDSHCECTLGWLEPLLERIAQNKSNVVTPVIDVIDDKTLQYKYGSAKATNLGGFDWNLQFNWHGIPYRVLDKRKSDIEPLQSPTMAGGLFAIDKSYFEHIGTYDSGMEIWGGENLELSFRVWMCGGALEIVLCSHVGHIFRSRSPYTWSVADALRKNSVRLALVWMDDYSKYFFERTGSHLGNYGDISERKNLRKQLKCKSFEWYLTNIYPELFIPGESLAMGEIRSKASNGQQQSVCLEASVDRPSESPPVQLLPCIRGSAKHKWYLTKSGEIRRDDGCIDYAGTSVMVYPCHGMKGNQEWEYRIDNTIVQQITNLCLEVSDDFSHLQMKPCIGSDRQIWLWNRHTPDSQNRLRPSTKYPILR